MVGRSFAQSLFGLIATSPDFWVFLVAQLGERRRIGGSVNGIGWIAKALLMDAITFTGILNGSRWHCWKKHFHYFFIGISTVLHKSLLSLNLCRHCWTPSPSLGFLVPSVVPSMLSSLPTTQFVSRLVHRNFFLHCKLGKHIFHATYLKGGLFQWR